MARKYYPRPDEIDPEADHLFAHSHDRQERLRWVAEQRQRGLMVLMENVENPYNLGAVSRTCDAFGVQNVGFTTPDALDFPIELATRVTSKSASKWITYTHYPQGTAQALSELKQVGWHIVAAVVRTDATPLYAYDALAHEQQVILVGNEQFGLSKTAIALADSRVYIPMYGIIRSFNVSVALAIMLAEIARQRHVSGGDYRISSAEAAALYQEFLRRDSALDEG